MQGEMNRWFVGYDAIVSPAAVQTAPLHEASEGNRHGYLTPYNVTGWPALVLPVTRTRAGLPVGVQIIANPWRENVALALGALIEAGVGERRAWWLSSHGGRG